MNTISQTVQTLHNATLPWLAFGQRYASELFGLLAVLEFALAMTISLFRASDIVGFFADFFRTFIELCAMFGVLLLGPGLMTAVIQGLMQYGATVSGVKSIQLSDLMDDGIDLVKILLAAGVKAGAHLSPLAMAILLAGAAIVGWGYLRLGKSYLMALLESYVIVGVAAIMLGFGALRHTRTYSERYVSASIGSGVKLMVCYFLVGVEKLLVPIFNQQANGLDFSIFGTQDITGALALIFGIALFFAVSDVDKLVSLIACGVVSFSGHDVTHQYMPFANAAIGATVATTTMMSRSVQTWARGAAQGAGRTGGIPAPMASAVRPAPAPPAGPNGAGMGRRVAAPASNGNGRKES